MKFNELTIQTLIESTANFELHAKQMNTGIEAAKQHIEGRKAAVRVFKRILRDTKNPERIKIVTKCLQDAQWELDKYQSELIRFEDEQQKCELLHEDFKKLVKSLDS